MLSVCIGDEDSQVFSDFSKTTIPRPQLRASKQSSRHKVNVDPPDPLSVQPLGFDKGQDIFVRYQRRRRKRRKQAKNLRPIPKTAARDFTNNERMAENSVLLQQ